MVIFLHLYVPRARFGGFEEVKVFSKLYNIGANLWVINEADKKLSNSVSLPIEGRPTANFLFDPIKGHYSLLDNSKIPCLLIHYHHMWILVK